MITVVVTSPNGPEGSAVLEVSGAAALGPVTSASGDVFFEPGVSATRIVVLLDTPGQIRFEMRSDDVGTVPQVTLVQVADGNDGLRASLSGYQIDLARIPDASVAASRRRP